MESNPIFGFDPIGENEKLRDLNRKLSGAIVFVAAASIIAIVFGVWSLRSKPEPVRIGVDESGRTFKMVPLTNEGVPQIRVTRMASDCVFQLLNHAWTSSQESVERAIGGCMTADGEESVRLALEPHLARIMKNQSNLVATYTIQPFLNKREVINSKLVYHYQAAVQLADRGGKGTGNPIEYVVQADLVRVSFDSHPEGVRLQNLVLSKRN